MTISTEAPLRPLKQGLWKVHGLTLILSAGINVLLLASPLFMLQVYDRVLTGRRVETLIMLALITLGALVSYGLLAWVRQFLLIRVGSWLGERFLSDTLRASLERSLAGKPGGTQAVRDMGMAANFLSGNTILPLFDAPWSLVFLAVLWFMHPWLGIAALIAAIALLLLVKAGELATRGAQEQLQEATVAEQRWLDLAVLQAEAVKVLGMRDAFVGRFREKYDARCTLSDTVAQRGAVFTSASRSLRLISQAGILGLGAYLYLQGFLSPGAIIAASILLGRALAPLDQLTASWRQIRTASAATDRTAGLIGELDAAGKGTPLPRPKGHLTATGAGLIIDSERKTFLLQNINLDLNPGEVLGLIGASGSGKTTLCRLVAGAVSPSVGEVRLDGALLSQWDSDELGRHIGYLPQNVGLPPANVADTIARLAEDYDPEEVHKAAMKAGIHESILGLPEGYDTPIGTGGHPLSSGQQQRIGLARAIYGNPPLILLDEPDAHLDGASEAQLYKTICGLRDEGAAIMVVSHRPGMLRAMNLILVLEGGRIVTQGPPSEILQRRRPVQDLGGAQQAASMQEPA